MMKNSTAALIIIMDVSGSMSVTKRGLARKYYYMYKGFLQSEYSEVKTSFIAHTTTAYQMEDENKFFSENQGGGTYISPAYIEADSLMATKYNPNKEDIYIIHFTDGDNWGEDNSLAVAYAEKLTEKATLMQFIEIKSSVYDSTMICLLEDIKRSNLVCRRLKGEKQCLPLATDIFNTYKDIKSLYKIVQQRDSERMNTLSDIKQISRRGKRTIVILQDGSMGEALCAEEDAYDEEKGFLVAYKKAKIEVERQALRIISARIEKLKKEISKY